MTSLDRKVWIIALVGLLAVGCSSTAAAFMPGAPSYRGPLVTSDPMATSTPTPFGPIPQTTTPLPLPAATKTPTVTPTLEDPWGHFQAPIEPSAIEISRPQPLVPFHKEVVNVLIIGSDQRPGSSVGRSDTLMVVSLDPEQGTVTLLSIPRDLYVFIPGWRVDRINTADVRGGPDRVTETILYNFGIEIHYWMRINFYGFITAIDALGGIEVEVTGYLQDSCGGVYWNYGPGRFYMDGFTALCYVRMRKTSSDFDRLRRQQEVIQALFNKVWSLNGISRVPELFEQFNVLLQTTMGLSDILPLIPLAASIGTDTSNIHRVAIDHSMVTSWRVPYSGASVLLPKWEVIEETLQEAFELSLSP